MELEKAVAEVVRDALHRVDLFNGKVFLAHPGVDLRQVRGQRHSVVSILGGG